MALFRITLVIVTTSLVGHLAAKPPEAASVRNTVLQIAAQQRANPSGDSLTDFAMESLYRGLFHTAITTGSSACLASVVELGQQAGWTPPLNPKEPEDFSLGYTWTQLYLLNPDYSERILPVQRWIESQLSENGGELPFHANPSLAALQKATRSTDYGKTIENAYSNAGDSLSFDHATDIPTLLTASRGYASLPLVVENLPSGSASIPLLEKRFEIFSQRALALDAPQSTQNLDSSQIISLANLTYGFAWGIERGLLKRDRFESTLWRNWTILNQHFAKAPDRLRTPEATGAMLSAGAAILELLGEDSSTRPEHLLAQAEKLLSNNKTPRSYARFVPERKDDLAWENDKVAFRIYGPELANSIESSGIDVWCKRVPYPIINHWYRSSLKEDLSYHQDRGEGYNAFKVGDSRGCGGVALWIHDIPVHSNTFYDHDIYWTKPDELSFRALYKYPNFDVDSNGIPFYEERSYRLRLGERLNEVTVRYRQDSGLEEDQAATLPFFPAIGLLQQSDSATLIQDDQRGIYGWSDQLDGKAFFSGVIVDPSIVVDSRRLPHKGQPAGLKHYWINVQLDEHSSFKYRTGFAWAGDGEINSAEDWLRYLGAQTNR